MTINILGVAYKIIEDDSIIKENADGLCKKYDKEIIIRPAKKMLGDTDSNQSKEKCYREVLRHEIIHAFFKESGREDWANDEVLVNYIAIQFPKLFELFNSQGCLL